MIKKLATVAALIAATLLGSTLTGPAAVHADAMTRVHYSITDAMSTTLPETTGGPYVIVPVIQAAVPLDGVYCIDAEFDMQIMNPNPYNMMYSRFVSVTLDGSYSSAGQDGYKGKGENITPGNHYALVPTPELHWTVPAGLPAGSVAYITLGAYAASTAAKPGDVGTVKYLDVYTEAHHSPEACA